MLTVSDTRTEANDESGDHIRSTLTLAGHTVVHHAICPDNPDEVVAHLVRWKQDGVDVVITTGGTGISRRDTTYEAIEQLIEKRLDGFGELFRMLSHKDVGSAAMLSRAVAGSLRGGGFVFVLPGSLNAVTLAMRELILPELGHVAGLTRIP